LIKLKLLFITTLLLLTLLMLGRETWSDVTLGALAQWGSNNYDALMVFPSTYPPRQNLATLIAANQANFPFQVGRVIGATAVMLQGVMEMADGGRRVPVAAAFVPDAKWADLLLSRPGVEALRDAVTSHPAADLSAITRRLAEQGVISEKEGYLL